jgi:hypothetical protein
VDGGPAPGGVTTYEVNDEGKLVNKDTGDEYAPGPDLVPTEETMPQWLWDQHSGVNEQRSPAQEADL